METFIFGHKNPDTDSIASSIALSRLKNKQGDHTIPCRLGEVSKESKFVLDYFKLNEPTFIENVKIQISDLDYEKPPCITQQTSIMTAFQIMELNNLKALPIVEENDKLIGMVTMKDIAMSLIKGDIYRLKTSLKNVVENLEGQVLRASEDEEIEGNISVIAFHSGTIKGSDIIDENSVIIVGNRYGIIEHAINKRVKLIIITGEEKIPERYFEEASEKGVNIICTHKDTYTVSKLIHQTNYVASIMASDVVKFEASEYLEDVKEEMRTKVHSSYPVVDDQDIFLGFLARKHVLNPGRKKVIIVDHNEYGQSAEGLDEANILEIVDHHKIGDISTSKPISFRNMPVGSTCTIVYLMYKESGIVIDPEIAGLMLSGIISDTLLLKSPTTTNQDRMALKDLNEIVKLDIKDYAMKMFKQGTSLEGQSIKEIFYKDFKEFTLEGQRAGVSQIFTLDIEDIHNREEEFIEMIGKVNDYQNHAITLMVVTDILKNGSYLYYKCHRNAIINVAFGVEATQGVFVKDIVSRKKQVLPKLIQGIRILK